MALTLTADNYTLTLATVVSMVGSGDVAGPVSATDDALVRFDGVSGKLIKNSSATLTDAGILGYPIWNVPGQAAPAVSSAGEGRLYYDSTADQLLLSENGGAYAPVGSIDPLTVGGWTPAGGEATITGDLLLADGFVELTEEAEPAASGAGKARIYLDSTSKILMVSEDAGAYTVLGAVVDPLTVDGWTPAGGTGTITGDVDVVGGDIQLDQDQEIGFSISAVPSLYGLRSSSTGGVELWRAGVSSVCRLDRRSPSNGLRITSLGADSMELLSGQFDGGSAIGFFLDTVITLSTAGAKLLSLNNNGVEKFFVDKDGDISFTGDLDHDGSNVGFYGTAPAAQSAAYARNATIVEDRTLLASASATTLNNNNVLAALIADLQAVGLLG